MTRCPEPNPASEPTRRRSAGQHAARRALRGSALLFLLLVAPAAGAREERPPPRILDLAVRVTEEGYRVSFRLEAAFTQEQLDQLHSGVPVTFRHRIELRGGRLGPLLPRKALGRTLLDTTARYDSLTRRYEVERRLRGKNWPEDDAPPESSERRILATFDEVERWMTVVEEVPLPATEARPADGLLVRVRSELDRRFVWLLFPSKTIATGEHPLEF